jgi:pilus assembly protein Flp/PilA
VRGNLNAPTGTKDWRFAEVIDQLENIMKNLVSKFASDESGATAIEYGLIAALIAVAIIGGGRLLGQTINAKFNTVAAEVAGA